MIHLCAKERRHRSFLRRASFGPSLDPNSGGAHAHHRPRSAGDLEETTHQVDYCKPIVVQKDSKWLKYR